MGGTEYCAMYQKGKKLLDYLKLTTADVFSLEINLGYCVAINCEAEKCRKKQLESEIEIILGKLWPSQVQK